MNYLDMNAAPANPSKGAQTPQLTNTEKRVVKMVMDLFYRGKRARADRDNKWDEYRKFYKGEQWLMKRPSYKASPNINIVRATIQTILPILTDTSPGFDVGPREPTDYEFADRLSAAIQVWWERSGMNHTMVEVLMDALMYDAGILKVVWDEDSEEGLGDVRCSVVDPRDIYIPEDAEDFDTKCPWVIERIVMTVGELKRRFPDKAKFIEATGIESDGKDTDTPNTEVMLVSPIDKKSPMGADTESPTSHTLSDDTEVEIYECWLDDHSVEEYMLETEDGVQEPGFKKRYPNGRVVTVVPAKRLLLQDKPSPYRDGRKPYVRFVDTLIPRSFWGEGEVEPLMEIQKLINKNMAVLIDWMNMMTNPVWIVDNESGVDPRRLTNQIGAIITKNKGTEVRREQAPSMPPQMFELYQSFRSLADTFSGVHDVTQGRKPAGVTAAEAINELQEAAQTRIRLKERNLQVSLVRLGYLVVSRILQFYNEPRMVKITGMDPTAKPEFLEFYVNGDGEAQDYSITQREWVFDEATNSYAPTEWQDINNTSKGSFDISVKAGTSLPFMKARRTDLAMQLFKMNVIDEKELLKTLDWPDAEQVLRRKEEAAQEEQAAQPPQGAPA